MNRKYILISVVAIVVAVVAVVGITEARLGTGDARQNMVGQSENGGNHTNYSSSPTSTSTPATIPPQFVDDQEDKGIPLSPAFEQIKTAADLIVARLQGYDSLAQMTQAYGQDVALWIFKLRAVGNGFVVLTFADDRGGSDYLVDLANGMGQEIPGVFLFNTSHASVYADYTDLYVYVLGSGSVVEIPGAKLIGAQTYDAQGGAALVVNETHNNGSIAISIFDTSQRILEPESGCSDCTVAKKVRTATFALP